MNSGNRTGAGISPSTLPQEILLTLRLQKGINRFVGRVASGSDGWRFWCEMMQL
ncbi:hypothetical protein [Victivallis sp.]|uniref:hypothetical protein n=1 Tax=Victivallis sp. TaxID=2049020 RepID=UPI003A8E5DF2